MTNCRPRAIYTVSCVFRLHVSSGLDGRYYFWMSVESPQSARNSNKRPASELNRLGGGTGGVVEVAPLHRVDHDLNPANPKRLQPRPRNIRMGWPDLRRTIMAHPLDHRQSAMSGSRLHVYSGRNVPVAAISCRAIATMLRSMILHCAVRPSTPCWQFSYTTPTPSLAL